MKIKELAEKYNDYIIEQRRYFHQYPELSLQEVKTTKTIASELEKMGIEVSYFDGITGCVGLLKGAKPGSTVLLRADIDGLTVHEQTGLPFQSKCDGKMHACGHDCHISMQLGAAKILSELKDELCGNVKFFFQPAEELAVGAKICIEKGVLDNVSACYGMHIWGEVDCPKINIASGERMASCDTFKLKIKGTSAHGSAPHLGKDAILAASAIIMNLQSIASRTNDPLNALVITIGTFNGGQRFNIIADSVELEGAARTFSKKFRMEIEEIIRNIAESTAKAYGCTAELSYQYLAASVINEDENLVKTAQNAASSLYGEDILVDFDKLTGSEDFSELMEKVPSVYAFLGARSEKTEGSGYSNHHEKFTPDEDALHHGAAIAAQFAYDYLKNESEK